MRSLFLTAMLCASLTFVKPDVYDAKINKPASKKQGILKVRALSPANRTQLVISDKPALDPWGLTTLLSAVFIGALIFIHSNFLHKKVTHENS